MRFTLIQLRKRSDHWALSINPDETDREAAQTEPHSMGFYHAPRRHTVSRSLTTLKDRLIEDRRQMIATLEQEIAELENVELAPMPGWERPAIPLYYEFPCVRSLEVLGG